MNQLSVTRVDVRDLCQSERQSFMLSAFASLPSGETMELVDDHDPRTLHSRFQSDVPGKFIWSPVELGPVTWRVAITKLQTGHSNGQCCGSCGGG